MIDSKRALYEDVFAIDAYSEYSPGEKHAAAFLEMSGCAPDYKLSVLDAGSGSGKGALALKVAGFGEVRMCDVTDAGLVPEARVFRFVETRLENDLSPCAFGLLGGKFDYAYCCDVMEHVEQQFTMLVARRILDVVKRGAFFAISCRHDEWGYKIGRPLHETVKPFLWWRDNLRQIGSVVEARDLIGYAFFYVEP